MEILKKFFLSTKITSILFLIIAISMAIATFIEKKYSTNIAKIFIYESTWFEIIISLIVINLVFNIWKYKLWNNNKIPVLIFHLSFIFIFIGGILSRYFSDEGVIYLREGRFTNKVLSQNNYIKLSINKGNYNKKNYFDKFILSSFHKDYKKKFFFKKKPLKVSIIKCIPCPKLFILKNNHEKKILRIIYLKNNNKNESFLKENEKIKINKINFYLNKNIHLNGIQIFEKSGNIYIRSSFSGKCINMINGISNPLKKNYDEILKIRHLYEIKINSYNKFYFVIPEKILKGKLKYIQSCEKEDDNSIYAITAKICFQGKKKIINFFGGNHSLKMSDPIFIDKYKISIGYGSKFLNIPFYLRLNKFNLENYPGSNSPSSYTSEITLIDKNKCKDYIIYMNNVLNYKGYRFFQSGYDPDNKGTYLFINNNYLGTLFSYIGYIFMVIGMFFTLFWKGTRFDYLKKKLNHLTHNKNFFIIFFITTLLGINNIYSQFNENSSLKIDEISDFIHIPKKHSDKFAKLLVQDPKGRIKPINTMAIELLRKIYKKDSIGNIDANQWFISMHQDNIFWMKVPFIKMDKNINFFKKNKSYYASLMDFYVLDKKTSKLKYIFQKDYQKSFSKNPIHRNEYDKSIIRITERVGIIHEIFQGKYTRIFPIPNDNNNTWSSWIKNNQLYPLGYSMLNNYLKSLLDSENNKNWNIADNELNKIKIFQIKNSKLVLPSKEKISAEIIYNKINIFYYLSFFYIVLGIIIILNSFSTIFFKKKIINFLQKIFLINLFISFIIQFFGLIIRWYISNHAPWTNGYESAIFISWSIIGVGLFFYKNKFLPGITSLISSILLMIAHGNAMDPEITNLVPVLKSSWLITHVATITSSYGFFFTSSVIGILVLILFIFKNIFYSYSKKIFNQIQKLTIINEMCLTIGIFLLTIGTILGSVWANNSWGRYWSWDPKETWAFISIMIYAFILHIRFIPKMKNIIIFNFLSVLSIITIIMTYFGVNYYLSGLHSYAKGDPISIPNWIYYMLLILLFISSLAFYCETYKKIKIKEK
ncbi:cytochrome c biogenesis protein CcsA [Blattabacterium cuenoti]|uniref:cytochrome c biogenesis protein CcsA n=1 Tax=Blattabacterium cuenoti TaxID=1653831 RepID=UPI00163C500D|nr:cytochrome c biogenesis protein CcsA [Blattabacterium cuenoti]